MKTTFLFGVKAFGGQPRCRLLVRISPSPRFALQENPSANKPVFIYIAVPKHRKVIYPLIPSFLHNVYNNLPLLTKTPPRQPKFDLRLKVRSPHPTFPLPPLPPPFLSLTLYQTHTDHRPKQHPPSIRHSIRKMVIPAAHIFARTPRPHTKNPYPA